MAYVITGLGPVFVRISNFNAIKVMLEKVMLFKETAQKGAFFLFEIGEGDNGASIIVEQNADMPEARQGFGTVHHATIQAEDRAVLEEWIARLNSVRLPNCVYVNP